MLILFHIYGHFPQQHFLVNYLGTFLVYLVKGYLSRKQVSKRLLLASSDRFLRGLTTFSSLLLDSLKLLDLGRYPESRLLYLALSIGGSLWLLYGLEGR